MATNKPRIPVTMEPELFERVTAYRRENGISSLSKAIRQLVRIALDSPESGRPSVRVREEGFASRGEQAEIASPAQQAEIASPEQRAELSYQELKFLAILRELDPVQQAALLHLLRPPGEPEETRRTP